MNCQDRYCEREAVAPPFRLEGVMVDVDVHVCAAHRLRLEEAAEQVQTLQGDYRDAMVELGFYVRSY